MKCNKCMREFTDDGMYQSFHNANLHKISIVFGYGSTNDGEEWEYWKCDECLAEEVNNFKILPEIKNYELI